VRFDEQGEHCVICNVAGARSVQKTVSPL
jgi:hypothetical protein